MNQKIKIVQGDITKLKVDAIVNAANHALLGGGEQNVYDLGEKIEQVVLVVFSR